jgi:hypothetical protein
MLHRRKEEHREKLMRRRRRSCGKMEINGEA